MRSITGKLTLAFLIIGVLGAVLVAWFIRQSAQRDFAQFVIITNEESFQRQLSDLYQINGNSWENIERHINRRRGVPNTGPKDEPTDGINEGSNSDTNSGTNGGTNHGPPRRRFYGMLADADGNILVNVPKKNRSPTLTQTEQDRAKPIVVENDVVGWLLITPPPDLLEGQSESFFLQRFGRAVVLGALGGALLALVIGAQLARTLTKPIHQLTTATKTVAQGDLGVQVDIKSNDEIGQLADSFNAMSAQLAQSNESRRQMTADIAHDLRTPLSVILGYTEALNDGKLNGNADMYEVLHRQAQHLNHLIEELRTLSLADAGKLALYKQSLSPQTMLEETQRAYRAQAENHGVSISIDAVNNLPTIEADPERMAQVLGNLVSNALRYTNSGGQIILGAASEGNQVEISVADTGSGIAPADLAAIFERFYQVDKSRSEEGASGLGLPIAKSIVEAHGGSISVESEVENGTTFRILLPG